MPPAPPQSPTMKTAYAAGTLLALLLAACGQPAASPTPSAPGATQTPGATSPASPAASPAAGATGTPTTAPPSAGGLAHDSIVATTVDGLNVRAAPGTASQRLGTLTNGAQSFVVSGPQQADGYSWYLVSALGLPPASGCAGPIQREPFNCPVWFGWVASGSPDGVAWIAPSQLECPDPAPYEAEDYNIGKPPLHLLHCYGGRTLTLRAWLPEQPAPQQCPGQDAVPWLVCPEVTLGWSEGYPSGLSAAVAPNSDVTLPAVDQWVEVTGHMDDPAASQCRPAPDQPVEQVVVYCRAQLVLDSIAPTAAP